jgi:hypothetical protein
VEEDLHRQVLAVLPEEEEELVETGLQTQLLVLQ